MTSTLSTSSLPSCSPSNIDLCDHGKKKEITDLQALFADDLELSQDHGEGEGAQRCRGHLQVRGGEAAGHLREALEGEGCRHQGGKGVPPQPHEGRPAGTSPLVAPSIAIDRNQSTSGFNKHVFHSIELFFFVVPRGVSTEWGVHAARWSRLLSGRPTSRLRLAPLHPAEPTWVSGRSQALGGN